MHFISFMAVEEKGKIIIYYIIIITQHSTVCNTNNNAAKISYFVLLLLYTMATRNLIFWIQFWNVVENSQIFTCSNISENKKC